MKYGKHHKYVLNNISRFWSLGKRCYSFIDILQVVKTVHNSSTHSLKPFILTFWVASSHSLTFHIILRATLWLFPIFNCPELSDEKKGLKHFLSLAQQIRIILITFQLKSVGPYVLWCWWLMLLNLLQKVYYKSWTTFLAFKLPDSIRSVLREKKLNMQRRHFFLYSYWTSVNKKEVWLVLRL